MLRTILLALAAWLAFGFCASFADAAPATTIAILPWYQFAEPYILTVFGIVFSMLLTWALAQLQIRTGLHVSDQAKASVQQAAMNAAGRIVASQEGNVATLKIDLHSPLIAAEIPKLQASVGDAIAKLGMTPERVGDLIQGKLGQLQAQASSPTVIGSVVVPSPTGVQS